MSLFDSLFTGSDPSAPQSPLDALFSVSPATQQMARQQAMMGIAAGLLQASGPSRFKGMGGVGMGQALQNGMTNYNNALQNGIKQQAMAGELAKDKLGVMQGLAGQAAMARAFGQPVPPYLSNLMGGGNTTATGMPAAAPAAPADNDTPAPGTWGAAASPFAGAGFASVAGLAGSAPDATSPVSPNATPASASGQSLLRLPSGMDGSTAYALSMNPATAPIVQKAIENQYPGPSKLATMLIEQGVQPGSPQWNAAMAQGVFQATYVAPTAGRPGGYLRDPRTGQLTWLPSVPQGAMPVMGPDGQPTGAVQAQPGAADVARTMSTATSYGKGVGKAYTTPQTVIGPNGAPAVKPLGSVLGLPAPADAPAGAASPLPAGSAPMPAKNYPWPVGSGNEYNVLPGQTGLAPGQQAQADSQAKNSEKLRQANTEAAQLAQQSNYKLDRMEAAMQHFSPGPAASWKGNLATLLSKYGLASPDVNQYLGAMTEYNKYSTQLGGDLANTSKAGNAVTVFETMQKANPNVLTPVDAAHNIIASNRALNDYTIARSAMQNAWAQSHQGNVNGFNDWYTNNVNPNAFLLPKMNQAERQNYFKTLPKPQLQQLMKDYQNVQTWKRQGLF